MPQTAGSGNSDTEADGVAEARPHTPSWNALAAVLLERRTKLPGNFGRDEKNVEGDKEIFKCLGWADAMTGKNLGRFTAEPWWSGSFSNRKDASLT